MKPLRWQRAFGRHDLWNHLDFFNWLDFKAMKSFRLPRLFTTINPFGRPYLEAYTALGIQHWARSSYTPHESYFKHLFDLGLNVYFLREVPYTAYILWFWHLEDHRITELQVTSCWKGQEEVSGPTSCSKQEQLGDQTRLLSISSTWDLKTSRDGDWTAPPVQLNLSAQPVTSWVSSYALISYLKLLTLTSCLLPLILPAD